LTRACNRLIREGGVELEQQEVVPSATFLSTKVEPRSLRSLVIALAGAGLLAGFAAQLFGFDHWSSRLWTAATIPVLLVVVS
jgi:hypothetical protein